MGFGHIRSPCRFSNPSVVFLEKPLSRFVAISDHFDAGSAIHKATSADVDLDWKNDAPTVYVSGPVNVVGGYLDRLPLAAVAAGLVEKAEVWSFSAHDRPEIALSQGSPTRLTRHVLRADSGVAPYRSDDALACIRRQGPPEILAVWGLGVDETLLDACRDSLKVYNSIDAEAIRIPPEVSRHFDVFLTGAEWQSDAIRARHPNALCAVLPIGPEFASDTTFHPTGAAKDYDVVYVAATQPYKRHDLLLDTLARVPDLRALCVVGYGHLTDGLRHEAQARGLSVDWTGPLDHAGVNAAINRARVGLVCGVDDGAPAILTEYMLAGLPMLANARLTCGLQYILPGTGVAASEEGFAEALLALLARSDTYETRAAVQARWTWPHSIRAFAALLDQARARRADRILP